MRRTCSRVSYEASELFLPPELWTSLASTLAEDNWSTSTCSSCHSSAGLHICDKFQDRKRLKPPADQRLADCIQNEPPKLSTWWARKKIENKKALRESIISTRMYRDGAPTSVAVFEDVASESLVFFGGPETLPVLPRWLLDVLRWSAAHDVVVVAMMTGGKTEGRRPHSRLVKRSVVHIKQRISWILPFNYSILCIFNFRATPIDDDIIDYLAGKLWK